MDRSRDQCDPQHPPPFRTQKSVRFWSTYTLRHIDLRKDVARVVVPTRLWTAWQWFLWLNSHLGDLGTDSELRMDQTTRILSSLVFQVVHRPGGVPTGPGSSRSLSGAVRDTHGACNTLITPKIQRIPWYHLWVLASLLQGIQLIRGGLSMGTPSTAFTQVKVTFG